MRNLQPKLYYNGRKDDQLAIDLLAEAGIAYVAMGPTTFEPTPYIEYGYWKYDGIKGISRFIDAWRQERLPSMQSTGK